VLISKYARPDALFRSQLDFWRWLPEVAPSERAFFEAFFTWVYTPRAHADGSGDQIVEEALAFPHKQSVEAFQAQVDVCRSLARPKEQPTGVVAEGDRRERGAGARRVVSRSLRTPR
jgi:hypothetical protein